MTYNSRPLYGIKESFFGPAAYREAEFQQSIKPQPTQSMSVGDSKTKATIEGYEKTQYPQAGVKQELMGAAAVSQAQSFQSWSKIESDDEEICTRARNAVLSISPVTLNNYNNGNSTPEDQEEVTSCLIEEGFSGNFEIIPHAMPDPDGNFIIEEDTYVVKVSVWIDKTPGIGGEIIITDITVVRD